MAAAKPKVRRGCVADIAKTMAASEADGENVGIVKFGAEGARLVATVLDERIGAGGLREWAPRAFGDFARRRPLYAIGTRGFPWTEIDFPEDYERAVREVLHVQHPVAPDPIEIGDQRFDRVRTGHRLGRRRRVELVEGDMLAQSGAGSIEGTIQDATSAALPGSRAPRAMSRVESGPQRTQGTHGPITLPTVS